jgi:hypothetical protein
MSNWVGVLHELHAAGVDDRLLVGDVGVFLLMDLLGAAQEQAVGQFMMLALCNTVILALAVVA